MISPLERDLLLLGFPAGRVGFPQLVAALDHMTRQEIRCLTSDVYPVCAATCGTTPQNVARNLHLMLDAAWYSPGGKSRLEAVTYGRGRPSDKEFLFLLAHYFRARVRVA